MNVIFLDSDEFAKRLIKELLAGTEPENLGGPKTVAVFSLPSDQMFFDVGKSKSVSAESKRGTCTIWVAQDMYPKRGEIADFGRPAKDYNKAMRATLTPQELKGADVFMAVNQSADLRSLDFKDIRAQLVGLTKFKLPQNTEGRAGAIAYTSLPQNRVFYSGQQFSTEEFRSVWYGTSGKTNLAELLLTLAAGYKLHKSAQFDNYGNTPEETKKGQTEMTSFVAELERVTGVDFRRVTLTDTADILNVVSTPVRYVARDIETTLGHSVGLCGEFATDSYEWLDRNGHKTIEELHSEGYRFGGAPIYWAFYAQASAQRKHEPFCALVYDGSKGAVHRLAEYWMKPPHKLWIIVAGNFRIQRKGKDYLDEFDIPWFLQTLAKQNKAERVLTRLWELALERVPLPPEKVGSHVVVLVDDDGELEVQIS